MQDVDYDPTDQCQASAIALPSCACLNCTESNVICMGLTVGGCTRCKTQHQGCSNMSKSTSARPKPKVSHASATASLTDAWQAKMGGPRWPYCRPRCTASHHSAPWQASCCLTHPIANHTNTHDAVTSDRTRGAHCTHDAGVC